MSSWTLTYQARPFTTNAERRRSRHERAALVREWRGAFGWLARQARIPLLDAVTVDAYPRLATRQHLQDTGGCHPAVKAAIDGLVDAGVLADDGPVYVRAITFHAPVVGGADALALVVSELDEPPQERAS